MDWRLLGAMCTLIVAAFVARAWFGAGGAPLIADTDDAMRLVVVRDLLAGQGWYDNLQHRLNTPFGAELHWSRLADLPLAASILVLRPIFGTAADWIAAGIVPLVLLCVLLILSGRIALILVGREGLLPAFALPAFSLSVLSEFAPGRVDHHALQILLLLALVWCTMEALRRPVFGLWAGIVAATGLAIGIESLPGVAAAVVAFGLMWVFDPRLTPAVQRFGGAFALAALLHLMVGIAPGRWLEPACDAISLTYVAAAVAGGLALTGLTLLPVGSSSPWPRLAFGTIAGGVVAGGLALAFPVCLGGPYGALDPWLVENWLNGISEVAPLWSSYFEDPSYALAVGIPPLVGLAAGAARLLRGPREARAAWWVFAGFLLVSILVMLVQVRGSRLATPLAVPACAWLIVETRRFYLARPDVARAGLLVLSWLASSGIAIAVAGRVVLAAMPGAPAPPADAMRATRLDCLAPEAFATLATMPAQRVMTPIDLGAHMLLHTPHEVVAAPYHRNQQGVRDTFAFFNEPVATARDGLAARGVTLVVVCRGMPEVRGLRSAAPNSFALLLAEDELPAWLEPRELAGSALEAYAVRPAP